MNLPFNVGQRSCLARWVLASVVVALSPAWCQVEGTLTADQVKAGFIYNFTKYIDWPSSEDNDGGHFHVCTVGHDGVTDQLESAVHGKTTAGRLILVRRLSDDESSRGCEILYVGNLPGPAAERLAASVSGQSVLTIGSVPRYLRGEGIVTFVLEDGRVRFDINLRLAEKLNIRFESRVLALARRTSEVSP